MASTGKKVPTSRDHLVAGLAAGFVSTVVFYPLELIKTRMQVEETRNGAYRTILGSFQRVLKQEGVTGLYKGLTPAVLASCGSWGGYFYLYEMAKKRKLTKRNDSSSSGDLCGGDNKLNSVDHLLAGFEAGVVLALLFQPLWLAKTRMALQGSQAGTSPSATSVNGTRPYNGMIDALVTIVKEEGVMGLYKGVVPALCLTSHGAVQFAAYEWLKRFFENIRANSKRGSTTEIILQPAVVSMFTGAAAKILASTMTYPYQVIRSRLQQRDSSFISSTNGNSSAGGSSGSSSTSSVDGSSSGSRGSSIGVASPEPKYTGTVDCAVKIWRNEGYLGFFRGVIPNAIKVAPAAALTFVVYEECLKFLINRSGPDSDVNS